MHGPITIRKLDDFYMPAGQEFSLVPSTQATKLDDVTTPICRENCNKTARMDDYFQKLSSVISSLAMRAKDWPTAVPIFEVSAPIFEMYCKGRYLHCQEL
jgi:hypothetical protein